MRAGALPRPRTLALRQHVVRPRIVTRRANGLKIVAERVAKGQLFHTEQVSVSTSLGSGSFGEVFKGKLSTEQGDEMVILKRVRAKVEGAQEMAEMEHVLNVYASRVASRAVADFKGYLEVEESVGRLTRGLWLVWRYQGDKTLGYYLKRRDCVTALARDLGVPEEAAVPTVMQQLFECLVDIHSVGLVHRDLKPANTVFDEEERRFKLIDLGATADLRTGTNYEPTETILDPCYSPPEEYVLPTDAPSLSDSPLAFAMSPLLWSQHRPDCFDSYSAGIILMQLAVPFLRTTSSLRNFNGALARCGYDLQEWRIKSGLPARQTAILDANDGAGWDLAAGLLRERKIEVEKKTGMVRFVSSGAPRLTPAAALKHPFIREKAAAPAPVAVPSKQATGSTGLFASLFSSKEDETEEEEVQEEAAASSKASTWGSWRSSFGSASGSSKNSSTAASGSGTTGSKARSLPLGGKAATLWSNLKSRLFDLEARIAENASAAEEQTTVVQRLREDVAAGRASAQQLEREELRLASLKDTLDKTTAELGNVFGAARGFLSAVTGGGSGSRSTRSAEAAVEEVVKPSGPRSAPTARPSAVVAQAEAVEAEPGQQQTSTGAGKTISGLANNLIYTSLKGLAAGINKATDLLAAASEVAERQAAASEAERLASTAFVKALQAVRPAISSRSTYWDVAPLVPQSEEYAALPDFKRRQVFGAYILALRRAERSAEQQVAASFQQLLAEAGVSEQTDYVTFSQQHAADARLLAVGSDSDRLMAFEAYVDKQRAAREAGERKLAAVAASAERAAQREAERAAKERASTLAFLQLLREREAAVVACAGNWTEVKRRIWTDGRYDAVPTRKAREALFAEFVEELRADGRLPAGPASAAPARAPRAAGSKAGAEPADAFAEAAAYKATVAAMAEAVAQADDEMPEHSLEQLDFLRQEQQRLKAEYEKMEAKLKEMERQLQVNNLANKLAMPARGAPESVTIRLGAEAPKENEVAANGVPAAKE